MALLYTTLEKEAHAEQTIEKSRFIAHAAPAASREEAELSSVDRGRYAQFIIEGDS